MLFPEVKMVDKIQYDNYHRKLSCYCDFKFLVPLSDCQGVAEIPENILPEFSVILLEGRTMHVIKM